ncbi:hypothetical protein MMC06_003747 [Schaereria dolodes]|nr:hypothetical protein [Schaereria dolodes]
MLQPRVCIRHSFCRSQRLQYLRKQSYATAVDSRPERIVASTASELSIQPPSTRNNGAFALRTYKPRTPGVRHLKRPINDHLWKGRAHLPLTYPRKGQGIGGRNNTGRIMVRHRGGGHKRRIRRVDFQRLESGKHTVDRIEHDPGRSAHIALLTHTDTQVKSYIVASEGMREGDVVQSYRKGIPPELTKSMGGAMDLGMIAAKTAWRGNCLPLHMIPVGTLVYNVGLSIGKGGQLCRSAGTHAQIVGNNDDQEKISKYVNVRLQSGETRKIHRDCCATIGVASNGLYRHRQLGKAGRKRWLGIRPTVRGLAMNAADHPHGGGRGKSKGNVHPVSPWGIPAKGGFKTRKRSKSNAAVVIPRPRNQGRRRRDQSGPSQR